MKSAKSLAPVLTACTLALSIALVGCSKNSDAKQGAAAAQQMPPPQVGFIVAQPQSVEQTVQLTGRTTAYQISEVRPQTGGVILKRLFAEGSYVREGQALYQLDSSINRAQVASARAALARQQANLNALRVKANRYQQLVGSNAISKQEYDDIIAQVKLAEADVAASRAALDSANINLQYSTIRAPISGQTGVSNVTAGALVTANQANALVTIQQLDPIYVNINQSSAELLKLKQQLSQGGLDPSQDTKVRLKLEDGSVYPLEGHLAFSGASVDQQTGTVTLRAVFDNPQHLLLPGMFATAEVVQGIIPNGYLIPQTAVVRQPTGQWVVYVVNGKGIAEARPVKTAGVQGNNWIINQGIQPGDKIIVDGVAKVKEGSPVQATPYNPNAKTPVKAAAASSDAGKKTAQS